MKKVKRVVASLLAAVLVLSAAACNQVGSWAMKQNDFEVPVGAYIMYVYNSYVQAASLVEDTSASPLGQKVEDTDATQWITNEALNAGAQMIAIHNLCQSANITLTEQETSNIQSSVNNNWDTNGDVFTAMGVSKDSLIKMSENTALMQKLFTSIYGEGGSKAVATADIEQYYFDHYTTFKYIAVSLTDSSGNDFSQEDKDKTKENLQKYLDSYLEGKTFSEVTQDYNADHPNATVTGREVVTDLESASYSEEITKALNDLSAGEGTIVTSGKYMYLLFKYDISKETSYLDENKDSILYAMKGEEYEAMIEEEAKKITYEKNDGAISKYSPSWLEGVIQSNAS